jgi:hypothetical protein
MRFVWATAGVKPIATVASAPNKVATKPILSLEFLTKTQ